ncbi:hypothetical protein SUGI_0771580 [Cryptomeria japonica]|nr:hypothetical protein SUGI_0771580 [Cryptomeria japonica]
MSNTFPLKPKSCYRRERGIAENPTKLANYRLIILFSSPMLTTGVATGCKAKASLMATVRERKRIGGKWQGRLRSGYEATTMQGWQNRVLGCSVLGIIICVEALGQE